MPLSHEEKVQLARLEQMVEFKTKRVKRLAKIATLSEEPGWEAQKEELELSAKAEEDAISADLRRTLDETFNPAAELATLRARAAKADAYRAQIYNVERAQEKINALNDQIGDHKAAIRDITNKPESKPRHGGVPV